MFYKTAWIVLFWGIIVFLHFWGATIKARVFHRKNGKMWHWYQKGNLSIFSKVCCLYQGVIPVDQKSANHADARLKEKHIGRSAHLSHGITRYHQHPCHPYFWGPFRRGLAAFLLDARWIIGFGCLFSFHCAFEMTENFWQFGLAYIHLQKDSSTHKSRIP